MLSIPTSCVAKGAMPSLLHNANEALGSLKRGNNMSLSGTEQGFTDLGQIEHCLKPCIHPLAAVPPTCFSCVH